MNASKPQKKSANWYEVKESHNSFGLTLIFALLKLFPAVIVRALAFPVGFFYWLFGKKSRAVSSLYLEKIKAIKTQQGTSFKISTLKHVLSFAITLTEKVEVWANKFSFKQIYFQDDDVKDMIKNLEEDKGVMVFISHLGNSELLRGLAHSGETGVSKQFVVNAIADVGVTSKFNGLLKKINSSATMHLFNASGIGPDTMVQLQEKIAAGEMVVIAGDRISATSKNRFVDAPFLGHTAHFAYGAFLLAALLNAPTYFIFGQIGRAHV